MRPLRAALAACALAAIPAALFAQQTQTQTTTHVRPIPPVTRPHMHPHPAPSAAYGHGYNGHGYGYGSRGTNPYASTYPVVIDGSVVNRFLATPSPGPKAKRTPAARLPNGEQVFETHSTNDAR